MAILILFVHKENIFTGLNNQCCGKLFIDYITLFNTDLLVPLFTITGQVLNNQSVAAGNAGAFPKSCCSNKERKVQAMIRLAFWP